MRPIQILALLVLLTVSLASCGQSGSPGPTVLIVTPTPLPASVVILPSAVSPTDALASASPTDAPPPTAAPVPTETPAAAPTVAASAPAQLQVRLSQAALIAIFRGEIRNWNDQRIQADNPGIAMPDLPIRVVYRSDSSGTTRALTEYFVEVDSRWAGEIGAAYRLGDAGSKPWPVGEGTSGSSKLVGAIKQMPGAIGYAAPSFALKEQLPVATIQNNVGNWVAPEPATLGEAASGTLNKLDERLRGFIVNAPGPNAYPITLYSWIIACPSSLSLEQAQALTDFLYWAISDPQAVAAARKLGYEAPPAVLRRRVVVALEALQVNGQRVFTAPDDGPFTPRRLSAPVALSGSGATLPDPLYQEWIRLYQKIQPDLTLSYQAQGSTKGREDLLQSGVVQFAGTEEAVVDRDPQISRPACLPAPLHVPMIVGSVGVVYNLPAGR